MKKKQITLPFYTTLLGKHFFGEDELNAKKVLWPKRHEYDNNVEKFQDWFWECAKRE